MFGKAVSTRWILTLFVLPAAVSSRDLAGPAADVTSCVQLAAQFAGSAVPALSLPYPASPWAIGLVTDDFPSSHGSFFSASHLDTFPTGRDLWSLLENQDSASVVNRIDVAGISGGTFALFSARGSSWTQNRFYLNGLDVTEPYAGGTPLFYPEYDALEAVQVSTGGLAVREPGGGSVVHIRNDESARTTHGDARLYYQGDPTGWENLTPLLNAENAPGSRQIRQDLQVHAQAGAPLGRRWSYLASLSTRHLQLKIPEFPETERRSVAGGLFDLSRHSEIQTFGVQWTGQELMDSHANPSFRTPVSSTLARADNFHVLQGFWRLSPRPDLQLDGRLGFARAHFDGTYQQRQQRRQSGLDLFTGFESGLAPLREESIRTRLSTVVQVGYTRGRSQIQAGFDGNFSNLRSDLNVVDNVGLRFLPLDLEASPLVRGPVAPSSVLMYNTPVSPRQEIRQFAFFAQHAWRPTASLSLRWGYRLDSSGGGLPRQSSPAGSFAAGRSFEEQQGLIRWFDGEPRLGLAFAPFCDRRAKSEPVFQCRTVFRAGFGMLHHNLIARDLDFQNPNSLSGTEARWVDLNGDGQYQAGEAGQVLRAFGGNTSSIDPRLKRPYSREIVIGAEQRLPWGLGFRADFFRRDEKDRLETVNIGVPFSAYTPVTVFDPGGDYQAGTQDDQSLVVFNQDPSTLGRDRFLLGNPSGLTGFYKGLEMVLSYRSGTRAVMALMVSAYTTRLLTSPGNTEYENDQGVIGGLLDNPNSLIGAHGRQYFDRSLTARFLGLVYLPGAWTVSTVTRYYDGLPFGRKLAITNFNQGPFFVLATPRGNPGGYRTEFNLTADIRARKAIRWGSAEVRLVVDVFNLLNTSNKTEESDLSGPFFSLRLPVEFQPPRIARAGFEFVF